jgi:hypothetical protein
MGRHAAVTYEQICALADGLTASGTTPSAKLLRQKLGDVGSLGTIQKFLIRWRTEKGEAQAATRMLPPELQRSIFKFTDEEVARINTDLNIQLAHCWSELADLCADNERREESASQLQAELSEFLASRAGMEGRMARLLDEIAAAHEELTQERRNTELARIELARVQMQLDALEPLKGKLKQLHANFEEQRRACVRAEQSAAVLAAQKADLEARLTEMRQAVSSPSSVGAMSPPPDADKFTAPGGKPAQEAPTATKAAEHGSAERAPMPELTRPGAQHADPIQKTLC